MLVEPRESYLFDRCSPVNCDQRIGSLIVPRDVNIAPMKLVSRIVALLDAAGVLNKYLPAECTISRCKIPGPPLIRYNPISFDSPAPFRATCTSGERRFPRKRRLQVVRANPGRTTVLSTVCNFNPSCSRAATSSRYSREKLAARWHFLLYG